jgi:hypothetical protein
MAQIVMPEGSAMKIYLGNSIRLPLQPELQVIQEIPAFQRADAGRRADPPPARSSSSTTRRKLVPKP